MVFLTDTILKDVAILIVTSLVAFVFYVKYQYTYWSKRNIPFLPPTFLFGSNYNLLLRKKSIGEAFAEHYQKLEKQGLRYGGIYEILTPNLLIIDPEIIKMVLTKNFNHFQNRFTLANEEIDPLSGHLFSAKIPKWKFLRTKLSPTFTSGKMKMMFPTIVECGHQLENALEESVRQGEPIEIKDILARFTTDVIGSCAFGIDCNSLKDPNTEFRRFGKLVFHRNMRDALKRVFALNFPKIYRMLKFPLTRAEVNKFFINITKQTVEYREKNHVDRKDFLNLLIKLKNNESVDDDLKTNGTKPKSNDPPFTMNDIAAQSFVFFIAGFETSSSTMAFCLYEICVNTQIQDKLRNEIIETYKKNNGEITYEALMEMPYMDKVVNETLRKYPIVPMFPRQCTETFHIPDTDVVIEKGLSVAISVLGMHRDPKLYPNPEKFDPERFNAEEKAKRHPYSYLPFGEGPRNCIGKRFGLMQTKIGLTMLLKNYKFTLNMKTDPNLCLDKTTFTLSVKDGIWLDAAKIVS